jgi:hypothetical protein
MRASMIGLLVGLALAACSDGSGPSTEGTLVISTATGGEDPDQDGYVLRVDGLNSISIDPTGTAEKRLPSGRHTLRLLGVAEQCSVAPGDSLEVDVPPQGTVSVGFEVNCPAIARAPGIVRITAATTGPVPDSTRYDVWYEHYGAWDYGSAWVLLGTIDPNGTLVAEVAGSSDSGADPYWYLFRLAVPGACGYLELRPASPAPGFTITPGDTLDVVFAVTCSSGSPWDYAITPTARAGQARLVTR